MTSKQAAALAHRAVACSRWEWRAGMRDTSGKRWIGEDEVPVQTDGTDGGWISDDTPKRLGSQIPDLTDAATLGALVALVREAWGLPKLYARWDAYLGREHDPEDDRGKLDNDPAAIAEDNARQWQVHEDGADDDDFERLREHFELDGRPLGEGATEAAAWVAALEAAP